MRALRPPPPGRRPAGQGACSHALSVRNVKVQADGGARAVGCAASARSSGRWGDLAQQHLTIRANACTLAGNYFTLDLGVARARRGCWVRPSCNGCGRTAGVKLERPGALWSVKDGRQLVNSGAVFRPTWVTWKTKTCPAPGTDGNGPGARDVPAGGGVRAAELTRHWPERRGSFRADGDGRGRTRPRHERRGGGARSVSWAVPR